MDSYFLRRVIFSKLLIEYSSAPLFMGLTHLHRQGEATLGFNPGTAILAVGGASGQEQTGDPPRYCWGRP